MTRDSRRIRRRSMLGAVASGILVAPALPQFIVAAQQRANPKGAVVGEPTGEKVGANVLAEGGNAIDAIVAAALAAAVAAPHQTGIGGYGMHGIFAVDGGRRVAVVDGNSSAPAGLRNDSFRLNDRGTVPGKVNEVGWLAAGVPGILAGLQLAIDRFGTRSFGELARPAIDLARNGIRWPANLTSVLRGAAAEFQKDPGSRRLYFPDGQPLAAGTVFKNPELAELLESLASANSVEAFYRGDIAQRIADAFQKNDGLVTAEDLAAYRAEIVEPICIPWDDQTIHTAPPTAGGLTVLQAMLALRQLQWDRLPGDLQRSQLRIEALRLAWRDRLSLLGDPRTSAIPTHRLLSAGYAKECAEMITAAVRSGRLLDHTVVPRDHGGTIHLSAADCDGNFAALTLTHGNSFGARVTVPELGLTLGHGMSRFDPHPNHPNSPGPGKRPLHNMVPTIVTRNGQAILAVGGRGGRKIPNALFEFLTQFVVLKQSFGAALSAPRLHTEGTATLEVEKNWPADEVNGFTRLGYTVKTGSSATLSAVALEDGTLRSALR